MELNPVIRNAVACRLKAKNIELDEIDLEAIWDCSLNFNNNIANIEEEIGLSLTREQGNEHLKGELEAFNEEQRLIYTGGFFEYNNLYKKKVILVFGETRSGKTSLSFKILENLKQNKEIYIYRHPLHKLISKLGFNNMYNISELSRVKNCAIYIDEPQLCFPTEDKKSNTFLMKLYTLAGQRNITLILSTSDSRWVTKGTESFVNSWFVKDCEASLLKNGSRIKDVIKQHSTFGLIDFKLNLDEFLHHDRSEPKKSGRFIFERAKCWNELLSTPYQ